MYTTRTPSLIKALAKDMVWHKSRSDKKIYLTFDDGPTAGVTDEVLNILSQTGSKATFFCVGNMVNKNPELYQRIAIEGHSIGNHTMHHESGWNTKNLSYFRSYIQAAELTSNALFRPPYGRISKSQAAVIKKRSKIIMWDVLPGDFDQKISAEICLERIKSNTQNGSIIVLHDSEKCGRKVLDILPDALSWFKTSGFELDVL